MHNSGSSETSPTPVALSSNPCGFIDVPSCSTYSKSENLLFVAEPFFLEATPETDKTPNSIDTVVVFFIFFYFFFTHWFFNQSIYN